MPNKIYKKYKDQIHHFKNSSVMAKTPINMKLNNENENKNSNKIFKLNTKK